MGSCQIVRAPVAGPMKIAIFGSGHVGKSYAKLIAKAGHEVILTWSSSAASLERAVEAVGQGARSAEPAAAVSEADLVVFAPRWEHIEAAAKAAAPWTGKIVIDANNPYNPQRDGFLDLGGQNPSQIVIDALPGARCAKTFNAIPVEEGLVNAVAGRTGADRVVLFLSGDDAEAKKVVANLISEIGFVPFDLGSVAESGPQQPGGAYYGGVFHLRDGQPVAVAS